MKQSVAFVYFAVVVLLFGCNSKQKNTEQHPDEFVGKWEVTKKVYSNGIEDEYKDGQDVYYFNEGGKLRHEYFQNRKDKVNDQQGTWNIETNKSKDGKTDTTYIIKRTPMFNGIFEERFKVISKSETEMVIEENTWGFESADLRDKFYLSKKD
jgi:hypothetical protein